MYKRNKLIYLLSSILLIACDESGKNDVHQQDAAVMSQSAPRAVPVEVVSIEMQQLDLTQSLPGRTIAFRIAEVRPQVSGIVQKRFFVEGSEVEANQQLYQIDDSSYKAAYNSAVAASQSAQATASRYSSLVASSAVSKEAYNNAMSASIAAQSALKQAEINLKYTKVFAPISGVIGRSSVTEGALVTASQIQELAIIQQLDPIYVDVTQSTKELLALKKDISAGIIERDTENSAVATLILEDGSEYEHKGKLEFSESIVDASTGSVTLRAVFPNPENLLLPGMFVHAKLNLGINNNAIVIPQKAVQRDPRGRAYVMIVDEQNIAQQHIIELERLIGGNAWQVKNGLNVGDKVIVAGVSSVKPGALVAIQEQVAPQALGE